jgi:hypothetical protein
MIGKILGAVLGAQAAEHTSKVGGAGGAVLGVVAASVLRRMSIPAMLALGAGGYAYKKWSEKREAETSRRRDFQTPPKTAKASA